MTIQKDKEFVQSVFDDFQRITEKRYSAKPFILGESIMGSSNVLLDCDSASLLGKLKHYLRNE